MDMVERVSLAMWLDHVDLQGYPNGCPTWDEMLLMPSEQGVVEEVRSNAKAAIRAMLEGLEPVAFVARHQDGKGPKELSWKGERLTNADRELGWTETPLYDLSAIKEAVQ